MSQEIIPVFIGYDPRETLAYHVLANSIRRLSSVPVSICPIALDNIGGIFSRERDVLQSTDFAFSRFLTPYLARQMGCKTRAVFMDCDMLFRDDIALLMDSVFGYEAVHCVHHAYEPKTETKFLGNIQTNYPRKNWSSLMVFNLKHLDCHKLTPKVVNEESGKYLHQFEWTDEVGQLDTEWNWLVGEYPYNPGARNVHFTLGGPYFNEYKDCDYSAEWRREMGFTFHCDQLQEPVHHIHSTPYKDRPAVV